MRLAHVWLKHFGPYGGPDGVSYPLADRGLVLLQGRSTDGTGADSNGSGKTTLAMSTLWALTGSLDTRLVPDGKVTDVAYDDGTGARRSAEVSVSGTINGKEFQVTRRRGGRDVKGSELTFVLGGVDLTTQSIKDTQEVIDNELGGYYGSNGWESEGRFGLLFFYFQ